MAGPVDYTHTTDLTTYSVGHAKYLMCPYAGAPPATLRDR